jgi:hypothetical protein
MGESPLLMERLYTSVSDRRVVAQPSDDDDVVTMKRWLMVAKESH